LRKGQLSYARARATTARIRPSEAMPPPDYSRRPVKPPTVRSHNCLCWVPFVARLALRAFRSPAAVAWVARRHGKRTLERCCWPARKRRLMQTGAHVILKGLTGRSDLNGRLGKVVSQPNGRGRLGIKVMHSADEAVAVKPENVMLATVPPMTSLLVLRSREAENASAAVSEIYSLIDEWRALGLRVETPDWEAATATLEAHAIIPLLAWSCVESTDTYTRFCALLQALVQRGVHPQPDLRAIHWHLHKKYLLELRDAGVPIVPTALLYGLNEAALRAALDTLRPMAESNIAAAEAQLLWTRPVVPALGMRVH
jgi:hypothetical protein